MTREEAENLKSFDDYCICGGFAWSQNGRPESNPHMTWCPQKKQYGEWYKALHEAENVGILEAELDEPN
jgi:hypothetical protein